MSRFKVVYFDKKMDEKVIISDFMEFNPSGFVDVFDIEAVETIELMQSQILKIEAI